MLNTPPLQVRIQDNTAIEGQRDSEFAKHLCVSSRGIEDEGSATVTADYHGAFKTESVRREFLEHIRS